ncbi:MAG: diguanylate cyclase [Desulfuromonadaceae bacterium]|nr:diguanylate cyclase [Desulfuromonadaceae bacterium]MDD2856451.1 diguanylate cyclase [Desulfuromonadaceae bacterium]
MTTAVPILIVDDIPQNILALEAVISDMDFEIITAQSGNEALRQSLKHDFALILLDVQMPGMNGFEVARYIRSNPKTSHFPIIFVTAGMKDLLDQIEGYETGAVDYLMKPFEPVILRSKIKVFKELYQQRKLIEKFYNNLEQIVEERTTELREANITISRLAATDELTGLANRRSFNECLSSSLSAARRHNFSISLIMIDIDHFKHVNDTLGHSHGDRILRCFAELLTQMIRTEDIAARWGGEEFTIILPHTSRDAAAALAERIRTGFERHSVGTVAIDLSASFGVVELEENDDADTFIRRADDAMYSAKHLGRNRVVVG